MPEAMAASTTVVRPPAASATRWLPEDLEQPQIVVPRGDSARPVPDPATGGDAPEDDGAARRRAAADAYCSVLCPAATVAAAVEEALELAGDSDAELLRATRSAAAERAVPVVTPTNWRQRLSAEHEYPCQLTPARLAERANATLDGHDQRELEQHLSDCADCQAAAEREQQATEAFAAATNAAALATDSPTTDPPRRRRRLIAPLPVLSGIAALAVVIAAGAVILVSAGSTHHAPAPPTHAAVSVPTPTVSAPTTPTVTQPAAPPKHHRHTTSHRTPARHRHRKTVHHPTHKVTHSAPAATPVVTSPPATSPATSAPAVTTHSAAPVVHTTPPATSVSTVSQSSLPADSAPQQGVGKPGH